MGGSAFYLPRPLSGGFESGAVPHDIRASFCSERFFRFVRPLWLVFDRFGMAVLLSDSTSDNCVINLKYVLDNRVI